MTQIMVDKADCVVLKGQMCRKFRYFLAGQRGRQTGFFVSGIIILESVCCGIYHKRNLANLYECGPKYKLVNCADDSEIMIIIAVLCCWCENLNLRPCKCM
jgi:hypothetical protein